MSEAEYLGFPKVSQHLDKTWDEVWRADACVYLQIRTSLSTPGMLKRMKLMKPIPRKWATTGRSDPEFTELGARMTVVAQTPSNYPRQGYPLLSKVLVSQNRKMHVGG